MTEMKHDEALKEFSLERYRYIHQQVSSLNENVYKFLGIYQTLATALVSAALALFVGYKKWQISPGTARSGIIGLLCVETTVAAFTILLIVVGMLSWMDYRREEVELTDRIVHPGFRKTPRISNAWRWHESYIMAFIAISTFFVWFYAYRLILPNVK